MNDASATMSVGFIGLGDQGLPMAVALAQAGFELHVWARRPSTLEPLGDVRHVAHDSIQEVASASGIVALCVRTDDDVFDVVNGGLLSGLRSGAIVVNHGTGTPGNARRVAELCAAYGVDSLDAPVSGGRMGAEARTLTTLVGGPAAAAARCEPLFQSFSRHVLHLGDAGAGQAAKLFNNTLMIMNQANVADVAELADQYGLDLWKLIDAVKLCSGFSNSLIHLSTMITPATVDHLSTVEGEDMDIFAQAMTEAGIDAETVLARGYHGARTLPGLVGKLNR